MNDMLKKSFIYSKNGGMQLNRRYIEAYHFDIAPLIAIGGEDTEKEKQYTVKCRKEMINTLLKSPILNDYRLMVYRDSSLFIVHKTGNINISKDIISYIEKVLLTALIKIEKYREISQIFTGSALEIIPIEQLITYLLPDTKEMQEVFDLEADFMTKRYKAVYQLDSEYKRIYIRKRECKEEIYNLFLTKLQENIQKGKEEIEQW